MSDAVLSLFNIVKNNWNSANCDNITPAFYYGEFVPGTTESDIKRIDLREKAAIKFYQTDGAKLEPNGLGIAAQREIYSVIVDIRTGKSRNHGYKLVAEVRRICNGNIVNPDANFQIMDIDDEQDQSNNNAGLWRWLLTYKFYNYNKTRPT